MSWRHSTTKPQSGVPVSMFKRPAESARNVTRTPELCGCGRRREADRRFSSRMLQEAHEAGMNLTVTDGFRDFASQNAIPSTNTQVSGGASFHNFGRT